MEISASETGGLPAKAQFKDALIARLDTDTLSLEKITKKCLNEKQPFALIVVPSDSSAWFSKLPESRGRETQGVPYQNFF